MSGKFIFTCESRDQINEMFYFKQFMSILKFSGKFITIGLMLTYDAYVSLGGDIYLLDNPLSAVDLKVGKHVLNKCIKDLLGDKIVLFASHQQQHMENADEVIVLHKGRVLDKGRFTELRDKGVISSIVDPLHKAALKDKTGGFI